MQWLNIRTATIRAPEFVREEPVNRATWLMLLTYCAEQENGGTISGAGQWKDRTWQQTCGVTLREVRRPSRLWNWEGADLHLWGYPAEKELIVQRKREAASAGGKAKALAYGRADATPDARADALADRSAEGNGREGKVQHLLLHRLSAPALEEAKAWAAAQMPAIPADAVQAWHDRRAATGWKYVRAGQATPIADWQADLRSWARRWAQNTGAPSRGGAEPPKITTQPKNGW